MESGGSDILGVEQVGADNSRDITLRHSDGSLAGSILIHADRAEDSTVRAQLELRFADKSMLVHASEIGLDDARREARRTWILVKMDSRKSFSDPMRLSIDIPGKATGASYSTREIEAATARFEAAREAISSLRSRCKYPVRCNYPVCSMDENGHSRKLADDRCLASMVPLATFPLYSQSPST